MAVEQSHGDQACRSERYSLRVRGELKSLITFLNYNWTKRLNKSAITFPGKIPNYRHDQEEDDDQSGKGSESISTEDDESDGDVQNNENESGEPEESGRDNELHKGPTKKMKTENRVPDEEGLDDPILVNPDRIKREFGAESQSKDDSQISLSSGDQDDELEPKPNAATGPKLKLVFDVEFEPPI